MLLVAAGSRLAFAAPYQPYAFVVGGARHEEPGLGETVVDLAADSELAAALAPIATAVGRLARRAAPGLGLDSGATVASRLARNRGAAPSVETNLLGVPITITIKSTF